MKSDKTRCRELIKETALAPSKRLERLYSYFTLCNSTPGFREALDAWKLTVSEKPALVPGRRLPLPELRNGRGPVPVDPNTATWDIRGPWPMFRGARFDKWAVVCGQQSQMARQFVDAFTNALAPQLGLEVQPPAVWTVASNRPDDFHRKCAEEVPRNKPTFVLLVLPRRNELAYKRVKELLCSQGIPSQCLMEATLGRDIAAIRTKVAVQMAVKAGGAPWTVNYEFPVPTMVVGLDRYHAGDVEHRGGSVAAFVATLDRDATKFYSRTLVTNPREDLLIAAPGQPTLAQITADALEEFKRQNKIYPKFVLVYRDGGSEGQIPCIVEKEVRQMLPAVQQCGAKLSFIAVLKGTRMRIFAKEPGRNAVSNPQPGTIVDRAITSHLLSEVLMVAQSVNQGSATPVKLQHLYDDSPLSMDQFEQLAFRLTFGYYNWFGTVRVPSVLKYASTLAKFAGYNLRAKEAHANLRTCLFYL